MGIVVALIIIGLIIWGIIAIYASAKKAERERLKQCRDKYTQETPVRRDLILQLYHERLDLKEITFVLRKAGYRGILCEEITMKEIMEEHAQIQIEKHKGTRDDGEQEP